MSPVSNTRRVRVDAPDDALIRALAEHRTPRDGWQIAAFDGAPEPNALVILDVEDPDEQHRRLRAIRRLGHDGPVLIVGDAGVARSPQDEPVPRPVRLAQLLERLDALGSEGEAEIVAIGPYDFLPAERLLRHRGSGTAVRLTELEHGLLACLAGAKGEAVSREQLLAEVWGYNAEIDTHTVETHVWRLRQKIETGDSENQFFLTEAGGYRLALKSAGSSGED